MRACFPPLLLALALLAAPGAARPPGQEPVAPQARQGTARPAPALSADALVLCSAGMARIAPDARDQGLREILAALDGWMGALKGAGSAGPRLAARWLQQPFDLRAGLDDSGAPRLHLLVRFAELDAARADSLLLRKLLQEGGLQVEGSGDDLARFAVALPAGQLGVSVAASEGGAALALGLGRAPDPLIAPAAELATSGGESACAGWLDGAALWKGLQALVAQEDDEDGQAFLRIVEWLDLAGPGAPRRTFALRHVEGGTVTTRVVRGWARSHAGQRGAARITRADLRVVPADATWAWMGSVHPASVLELARALDEAEVSQALAELEKATGVRVERDLLANLGPLVGGYASQSTGGNALTSLVLLARSADASTAAAAFQKLFKALPAPQGEARFALENWRHGDLPCASLAFPGLPIPVEPSCATRDGWLILAMGRNALRQALDQLDAPTSLLDHGGLAQLGAQVEQGIVGLGFLDTAACLPGGYATASSMVAGLANMTRGSGAPDLTRLLPVPAQLARGLRPSLTLTRVQGEDLVTTSTHDASWIARATASLGSPMGTANPLALSMGASVAIPKLMAARLKANESAAIANLRAIASAQALCQSLSVIDVDRDGIGESGFLGELTAARPLRGSGLPLEKPFLSEAMGTLLPDGRGGALVSRSGYYFQVWLPGARGKPVCDPDGQYPRAVATDDAEIEWCAYAWPMQAGQTGMRCFFLSQEGDLLALPNVGGHFSGLQRAPQPSAARAGSSGIQRGPGGGGSWRILE